MSGIATRANGSLDPEYAALAALAFASSTPSDTRVAADAGASFFGAAGADALDLDLSDPAQARFGDYTLKAKLGQGGMGVVYQAHQCSLDRDVAVKLLAAGPWASKGFVERFRLEAQSAARMQHRNIVTIHEIGEQDGLPFFSMRLVRGRSLAERLAQGPMPAREAAALLRTVAEAVEYAHRLGVLHLDLKPGNVLIDEDGEPLVADFGLARRLEETLSGGDEISGTPSYMAPEQATAGQVGIATDVYALGATLFEALNGRPPFRGATARETLEQVVFAALPSPREFAPGVPADLRAICLRCLRKNPAERYPSARALAEDLADFLRGREVKARPLNRPQKLMRMVRREPRLAALVMLFTGSLLLGLFATTVQWNRAEAGADSARQSLWRERGQVAEAALAEGNGFHGLKLMVDNLAGMQAAGAQLAAEIERQRIGTLLANAPQLIDLIALGEGLVATSVAISPDGQRMAVATHSQKGRRSARQYDLGDGSLLWEVDTSELTFNLSQSSGAPHGRVNYSDDGQRIILGLMAQPVFAAPSAPDQLLLDARDGRVLRPATLPAGFADFTFDEQGRHAVMRWRTQPDKRFPDRFRRYRVEGWEPVGPELPDAPYMWLFAPDGQSLLRTSEFQQFQRVAFDDLSVQWTVRLSDRQMVRAWRWAPDGRSLALGCMNGEVLLVDAASGATQSLPSAPAGIVRWLEFDRDGSILVALSEPGEVVVWDMRTRAPRAPPLRIAEAQELGRVQVEDGQFALAHGVAISLWQVPPPAPFDNELVPLPARIQGTRGFFSHAFEFDAQRRLMVSGGVGALAVWRLPPPPLRAAIAAPLAAEELHFDGRRLVAVDGTVVRVVDIDSGGELMPALQHPDPVEFAELSPDGRRLLTIAGRTLRAFDAASGAAHGEPIVLPATPLRVQWAASAPMLVLVTGLHEGERFVERAMAIDHAGMQVRAQGLALPWLTSAARLDPLGRFMLASSRQPAYVERIDLDGPARCPPLEPPGVNQIEDVAISPDGSHAWIHHGRSGRRIALTRWHFGDCAATPVHEGPHTMYAGALQPLADSVLARGLLSRELALVDRSGLRQRIPTLPAASTQGLLALSADGRRAAVATRNAVQVHDLVHGERLSALLAAALPGHDHIAQLAFATDGERLLARSAHGRWMSWALTTAREDLEELDRLASALDAPSHARALDPTEFAALRLQLRAASRAARVPAPPTRMEPLTVSPARGAGLDPRFVPIDLRAVLNKELRAPNQRINAQGGNLASLPPGPHRLGGIDWRVDGGLQLSGGGPALALAAELPLSDWVELPAVSARRVHVLMLVHVPTRPGVAPWRSGRVHLRHADGSERTLDIWGLRDVVTHWQPDLGHPTARIAWRGGGGFFDHSHVYAIERVLPDDAPPVTALRLGIGESSMEAPLFYAVTMEIDAEGGT